ncbi:MULTISPECIES: RNA polymerase factor sigma-54 [unclassified Undibacterium]|uniref:RNA polymerase factor sigma-54 n=1 Tax=unclassified Undibacterium TaxID=2630295 RepID=UPI002AC8C4F6|nr:MULTISPECIES: RNA polymerase factor sigma-54 [unclassified Undibacterium]MEB0140967.1 RNA polymerase factor sigma-54 [Undibacterium sp. CCC2.1]MEB0173967.1 RNA polymerase factor sigma-54 [Undibacterium sp. CCC1.1]MEB0177901.1 RNA polymerase factor sigma-54 [Undibacterium sp. CCC3.4]MEB0217145.1 RNA polymerase factor sigma-54 [Undibacterium sp. 5I2]WPX44392.1 RNA polymerase factor sigma-54 [Undibacterium sp. CCC3.4]
MKQSLQLRTSQHLALTPQLQQSIRLLQLSTLELHQELENLLLENPLLERVDDPLEHAVRLLADGAINSASSTPDAGMETALPQEAASASTEAVAEIEVPINDSVSAAQDDWSDVAPGQRNDDDDEGFRQLEASHISLREHLLEQMRLSLRIPRDLALVELIIDAIDDHGYLTETLDEIHASLPLELCVEAEELSFALCMVQSFDPPGVGARHVAECLALQIKRLPQIAFVTRRLALAIIETQLPLFAQRDFGKLKKIFDCDDEDLREAQTVIRMCQPRPGSSFALNSSDYVAPDVIVKKSANGWQVLLNQDVMPKLRVNNMYANIMRQNRGDTCMAPQLQEARWLIKNMRQRFETILRVAQAIVERQRNFFTHGAVAMRPLVLREIADTLGLHESTISRVTTQKYMLTPHGMFELKYFFGSHVATETGGEASSTAIRALIKQLIGAEDQKSPLSDSKIADMLGEQGMVIARRTVAKYREALKIPPVSMRKCF